MSPAPAFQLQQRQFLNYLRQPQSVPLPNGFAAERLAVYADLLYSKFDESLKACFPVIRSILSKDDWRALLLEFIAKHRCLTPYYRQIPDEFVLYLQKERRHPGDWPFLAELAHFEWIELQLSIAVAEPITRKQLSDDELLNNAPVFAPVMQLLYYRWPVQDIAPSFLPGEPPAKDTHILGFRDSDEQVRFIALNPAAAKLILLLNDGLTGQQALRMMTSAGLTDAQFLELTRFGQRILAGLHSQGAIIDVLAPDYSEYPS